MSQQSVLVKIGAALAGSFDSTINQARSEINGIGDAYNQQQKRHLQLQNQIDRNRSRRQSLQGEIAGVAGIGLALTGALKPVLGFEQALADLQAVTIVDGQPIEKTSELFREMKAAAVDAGKTTVFTTQEATEAQKELVKSGVEARRVPEVLKPILNLANAADTSISNVAGSLTDSLSAMNVEFTKGNIAEAGDVIAATISTTNTTFDTLMQTMSYAAADAAGAGASFKELAAMTGILGNVGLKSTRAGTAMRSMYTRLAKPTNKATEELEKLNIATQDSQGNLLPMPGILEDMQKSMKDAGYGTAQVAATLSEVFGIESQTAARQLAESMTNGKFEQALENLDKAGGTSERMAEIRLDTVMGQMKILGSAISGLAIATTEQMLPGIKAVIQAVTAFTGALTTVADKYPAVTAALGSGVAIMVALRIATFGAALAGNLMVGAFLSTVSTFGKVVGAIQLVGVALRSMGAVALANPVVAIVGAIAAAAFLIYANWDTLVEWWGTIWDAVADVAGTAWEWVKDKLSWHPVVFLATHWGKVMDLFDWVMDGVVSVVRLAWDGIKTLVSWSPIGIIVRYWEPVSTFFSTFWTGVVEVFGWAWDKFISLAQWSPLGLLIKSWTPVSKFFSNMWEEIVKHVSLAMDHVSRLFDWIGDKWNALWGDKEFRVSADMSGDDLNGALQNRRDEDLKTVVGNLTEEQRKAYDKHLEDNAGWFTSDNDRREALVSVYEDADRSERERMLDKIATNNEYVAPPKPEVQNHQTVQVEYDVANNLFPDVEDDRKGGKDRNDNRLNTGQAPTVDTGISSTSSSGNSRLQSDYDRDGGSVVTVYDTSYDQRDYGDAVQPVAYNSANDSSYTDASVDRSDNSRHYTNAANNSVYDGSTAYSSTDNRSTVDNSKTAYTEHKEPQKLQSGTDRIVDAIESLGRQFDTYRGKDREPPAGGGGNTYHFDMPIYVSGNDDAKQKATEFREEIQRQMDENARRERESYAS